MDLKEFENHLYQGEGLTVEFKRCGNQPGRDTFETICSFANRQGGNIFLGFQDDGTVSGIPEKSALEIQHNIVNVVSNSDSFNLSPTVEFESIPDNDKLVLRIWIPMGPAVYRYKGVVYNRLADVDVRITGDDQLAALYMRKRNHYSERKVFKYLKMDDFRADLIERVRKMAVLRNPNHPWGEMDDSKLLQSSRLYVRDRETGEEGFTLAAALLLGTDDVIADVCPAYITDAVVRIENSDRYDNRLMVKTNLIDAYDLLSDFARRHLPDKFHLENDRAISPRDIIVREVVSNLLAHREYMSPFPAKLLVDINGLHTENASRSLFEGRLTLADFTPMPKNPIIADFFIQIGRAEKLGSGMRNLAKYTKVYSNQDPELIEGAIFRTKIPVPTSFSITNTPGLLFSNTDVAIRKMLDTMGYATSAEVAKTAGISTRTASRRLMSLVRDGILVTEGSTRDRRYKLATEN